MYQFHVYMNARRVYGVDTHAYARAHTHTHTHTQLDTDWANRIEVIKPYTLKSTEFIFKIQITL